MTSLKNVLEEIVVVEAQAQLKQISQPIREAINLSEVAAFALNRLPVLYASTSRGWLQQRKRAHSELKNQVTSAVQQALLGIKRDPLRKSTKLAASKVETPAHVLSRLQKLFSKLSLQWQDVPQAFQETLNLVSHSQDYVGLSINDRHRLQDIKGYLQRKNPQQSSDRASDRDWQYQADLPNPELNSYIISASYFLVNVLEDLAIREVKNQLTYMANVLPRKVGVDDVCAYVLNRLPAMYATSEQGVIWQTQKAKEQLSSQIESTVIQSLMTLGKTPRRLADPIPLFKFEEECEKAINELRMIFQRDDITWKNIASLAEYAINNEKQGISNWRQQWRMLGQIYSEMYLKPGDADLSLAYNNDGEVLIVKAHTKQAFGWLADNPKNLGISTLRLFPAVAEIELYGFFLDFSVSYTREEMAADGII
ncbi:MULTISPECIES: late competence development ComFB family protein [Pseudanabaena]|uniref:Late competence development protein ComFB n=2 Tax=Pseudanabaena TaxID=1152 RepID=L8MYS8_9CYAN|nr:MULTISPECIES: late competence development ComFB family protein [Pseudanabaena]ELS31128.1 Late competence development protein ComFB [Pseudanabaena biceps PCC 7429]MDG3496609.1 late competence development ComFB family protein [Pseudanabaena catenata USMAC16]